MIKILDIEKFKKYYPDMEINVDNVIDYEPRDFYKHDIRYEYGEYCNDCGEWTTNYYYIEDKDYYVCASCIDEYFHCDDCNNYYSYDTETLTTFDNSLICSDCYCYDYFRCDNCGGIFPNDYAHTDDHDYWYCDDCYEDMPDNYLYGYHEFDDWELHKLPDETPDFYIGHELEIDNGDISRECIDTITSKIDAICMHDGSLSASGIEIISHPQSYNYILSKEENYRDLFNELVHTYNYKSHNTDTCGLHFHITRPGNSDIIDRIILFMETYKDEIIKLSRRSTGEMHWCKFLSDKRYDTADKVIKSIDYIKKNKETSDRYMALNLTNSKTIEFRIFKGTLKFETFMSDLEFVYNLVTLASDLSIPLEELTWSKVTGMGKYLPEYIKSHELESDKIIVDYTEELIVEKNKKWDELEEEFIKVFDSILKILRKEINKKEVDVSLINTIGYYLKEIDFYKKNVIDKNNGYEYYKSRLEYYKERIDNLCA